MNKYESVIIINPSVDEEGIKALIGKYTDIINNDGKVDGWNEGLVIQDESENEYVWIIVPRNATVYNDLIDNNEDDLYRNRKYVDSTNEDILAFDVNNLTADNLKAIETELKEYTATYRDGTTFTDTFTMEADTDKEAFLSICLGNVTEEINNTAIAAKTGRLIGITIRK